MLTHYEATMIADIKRRNSIGEQITRAEQEFVIKIVAREQLPVRKEIQVEMVKCGFNTSKLLVTA